MRARGLVFLFLLSACGQADLAKSVKAVDGQDGESCLVQGNQLICGQTSTTLQSSGNEWQLVENPDGSITIIRPGQKPVTVGARGPQGNSGKDGKDGKDSCTPKFWLDAGKCLWVQCGDKTEKLGHL